MCVVSWRKMLGRYAQIAEDSFGHGQCDYEKCRDNGIFSYISIGINFFL